MSTVKKQQQNKKVRRRQQKKPAPAKTKNGLIKKEPDLRSVPTNTTEAVKAVTSTKSLQVIDAFKLPTIQYATMSWITKAMEKGVFAQAENPQFAYYAWVYATQIVANYAVSGTFLAPNLPYWMLALCKAVAQKHVPFAKGKIAYQKTCDDEITSSPSSFQVLGWSTYNNYWTANAPTMAEPPVNGFPVIDPTDYASSFDPSLLLPAFQNVCGLMADWYAKNGPQQNDPFNASKVVEAVKTSTPFDTDVSSYAYYTDQQGVGANGRTGGYFQQACLEVPIFNPILSKFNTTNVDTVTTKQNRFYTWSAPVFGDSLLMSYELFNAQHRGEWSNKYPCRLKYIDFMEWVDIMAVWVTRLQIAFITQAFNDNTEFTAAQAAALQCPLSLQQMALLLRASVMASMDNQCGVQSSAPFMPVSVTDQQFTPLVANSGTCASTTPSWQVPLGLLENIRACVGRQIKLGKGQGPWYYPVLMAMNNYSLNTANYVVTASVSGETYVGQAFATLVYERNLRSSKGITRETKVETPIDLIDGSSGSLLVAINDMDNLETLANTWNNWLKTTGLVSVAGSVSTFSKDAGASALVALGMTRFFTNSTPVVHAFKPVPEIEQKKKMRDVTLDFVSTTKKLSIQGAPEYNTQFIQAESAQSEIYSCAQDSIMKWWVLPTIELESSIANSTLFQRICMANKEPYYQTYNATGITAPSKSQRHLDFALAMIKGKFARASDWDIAFEEATRTGVGGPLSSLIAQGLGALNPTLGAIAGALAPVIPF